MKFNSQICTSREQSERLLSLGLKKETADMVLLKEMVYDEENHCIRDGEDYIIRPFDYLEGEEHRGYLPSWSLGRLLDLVNGEDWRAEFTLKDERYGIHYGYESYWYDNIFDAVIAWIEDDIKEGYFNKEYLVNQAEIEEHCKGVLEYLDYIKGEEE